MSYSSSSDPAIPTPDEGDVDAPSKSEQDEAISEARNQISLTSQLAGDEIPADESGPVAVATISGDAGIPAKDVGAQNIGWKLLDPGIVLSQVRPPT